MNIFRAYHRVMTNHPIKTQCITTALLVTSGDLIAQKLIEKQPELIVKRTVKFALFGLLFVVSCRYKKKKNLCKLQIFNDLGTINNFLVSNIG